jgi:ubiquinone/menaquinone biosynthesis C-methylase UbiE
VTSAIPFRWQGGEAYERYVGRWSRPVAHAFVHWLDVRAGGRLLDDGCGTGALTETLLEAAEPAEVVGVDSSEGYVAHARAHVTDPRATFLVGDAENLPFDDASFAAAVSALVLNFVPDPLRAVAEAMRVVGERGTVAAYVWDYAGRMELMRHFWDAAVELDPAAGSLDEGRRFAICEPSALKRLFTDAGLADVETREITVPTVFRDFDDYWQPFLSGEAPAPGYAISLDEGRRAALRERLRTRLPTRPDGSIPLVARAWAVRGTKEGP